MEHVLDNFTCKIYFQSQTSGFLCRVELGKPDRWVNLITLRFQIGLEMEKLQKLIKVTQLDRT